MACILRCYCAFMLAVSGLVLGWFWAGSGLGLGWVWTGSGLGLDWVGKKLNLIFPSNVRGWGSGADSGFDTLVCSE